MIRSKFKFFVYLYFFLSAGILAGCIYLLAQPELSLKGRAGGSFPAPVAGLFLLAAAFLLFITTAKKALNITINKQFISIKGFLTRKTIYQADIRLIDLLSMQNLYLTIGMTTVSILIELENGEKIILADPFYKNIGALKKFLLENFSYKIKSIPTASLQQPDLETDYQKISGNAFFNLNTFLFYGLMILFLIPILSKPISSKSFLFLVPVVVFYFGFSTQLYFFLVSNKRLVVKNHFLPWVERTYYIDEIIAVNFESPYRRSAALRITTKDFYSKSYSAGSLRQNDWNRLTVKLQGLGVNILR